MWTCRLDLAERIKAPFRSGTQRSPLGAAAPDLAAQADSRNEPLTFEASFTAPHKLSLMSPCPSWTDSLVARVTVGKTQLARGSPVKCAAQSPLQSDVRRQGSAPAAAGCIH